MAKRVISLQSDVKVYHKEGCPYCKNIGSDNRKNIDTRSKTYKKYRECTYCGGIRGWARIFHKRPSRKKEEGRMVCWYDNDTGFIFIKTNVGFWKLYWREKDKMFLLFHRNYFDTELSNKELMRGHFHRQNDVSPTESFDSIVNYIYAHDKNKEIASVNYRKLPKNTKKQKKYYNHHKRMARKEYDKRIDKLFDEIKSRK